MTKVEFDCVELDGRIVRIRIVRIAMGMAIGMLGCKKSRLEMHA